MGRLIAFDQQTASALVANTRTAAQLGHGSPLKAALCNEGDATLLMRGRETDELLVVNVRRPQVRAVATTREPIRAVSNAPQQTRPQKPAAQPASARPEITKAIAPPVPQPAAAPAGTIAAPPKNVPPVKSMPTAKVAPPGTKSVAPVPHAKVAPTAREPKPNAAVRADDMEPVAYEATGFLGLEDSPVYADDLQPKPKKKWWQKLLD
jgi:hypothetical protein